LSVRTVDTLPLVQSGGAVLSQRDDVISGSRDRAARRRRRRRSSRQTQMTRHDTTQQHAASSSSSSRRDREARSQGACRAGREDGESWSSWCGNGRDRLTAMLRTAVSDLHTHTHTRHLHSLSVSRLDAATTPGRTSDLVGHVAVLLKVTVKDALRLASFIFRNKSVSPRWPRLR